MPVFADLIFYVIHVQSQQKTSNSTLCQNLSREGIGKKELGREILTELLFYKAWNNNNCIIVNIRT